MAEITIRHRRSNQEGKVPTTGQLTLGELAVNTWDGRIFLKTNRDGFEEVVEFATVDIGNTTVLFADVQNKPTTLAGYGITDSFSGDYDDLTDKPDLTIYQLEEQAFDGDYNSLVNLPQLFDGQFSSLGGKPTTLEGYGITDFTIGNYDDLSNTPFIPSDVSHLTDNTGIIFTGEYSELQNKPFIPVNIVDLGDVSNTAPTSGQVLKWSGTTWEPAADTGNADTLNGEAGAYYLEYSNFANTPFIPPLYTDSDALSIVQASSLDLGNNSITTTGKVLYSNVYDTLGDLPAAATYHGMFAHVHAEGAGYFAHAGNWVRLANQSELFSGSYNDLSNQPTIPTQYTDADAVSAVEAVDLDMGSNNIDTTGAFNGTTVRASIHTADPSDDLLLQAGNGTGTGVGGTLNIRAGVGAGGSAHGEINIGTNLNQSGITIGNSNSPLKLLTDVPATSLGASGDEAGMVAFDASYIYYCVGTYNGIVNIWRRVAWSADTW